MLPRRGFVSEKAKERPVEAPRSTKKRRPTSSKPSREKTFPRLTNTFFASEKLSRGEIQGSKYVKRPVLNSLMTKGEYINLKHFSPSINLFFI